MSRPSLSINSSGSDSDGKVPLFRVAPCHHELSHRYRGIEALNDGQLGSSRPFTPSKRSHSSSAALAASPTASRSAALLPIHSLAVTSGHLAVSLHEGRMLAVFDAVPNSQLLNAADAASLHAFLQSDPSASVSSLPQLLALRTAGSSIAHMQFLQAAETPPSSSSSSFPSVLRLLVVQADASFLLWQWSTSSSSWNFAARGCLPVTHRAQNRRVVAARYSEQEQLVLWCEEYRETRFAFTASLPSLRAAALPELVVAQSATVVPLWLDDISPATAVTIYHGRHGFLLTSASAPPSSQPALYYWHTPTQQLVELSPPASASVSDPLCLCHEHAMTGELCCLTADGVVHVLEEAPPAPTSATGYASPFLLQPVAEWKIKVRLLPPAADDDEEEKGEHALFPLTSTARFVIFHQTVCVITPAAAVSSSSTSSSSYLLSLFTAIGGVCLCRVDAVLDSPLLSELTAQYGYGGTGVVLCSHHALYCLVSAPLSLQLKHLTAASPHADRLRREEQEDGLLPSETCASPSFAALPSLPDYQTESALSSLPSSAPSSPPLSPVLSALSLPPSALIPSVPYPFLSRIAAELSAAYGSSLSALHHRYAFNRWIGMVTAGSRDDLVPPALRIREGEDDEDEKEGWEAQERLLRDVLAGLQSPALVLSLLLMPSVSHHQHGHRYDARQLAVAKAELERWLQLMEPLVANKPAAPASGAAKDRHAASAPPSSSLPSPSSSFSSSSVVPPALSQESMNRYTPLNLSLYPLLSSLNSLLDQIDRVPSFSPASTSPASRAAASRPPSLPPALELPSLLTLSSQLSRAVANRSTSQLSQRESSLASLALSAPSATFLYLRSLMGLDELTPLPEPSASPSSPASRPTVHPNLLLLNDEIRLKKELGVYGKDIAINTAALQRSDAMPYFELLCRLYYQLQPALLPAFVSVMEDEEEGGGVQQDGRPAGVRRWQELLSVRDVSRYCERALLCLPPLWSSPQPEPKQARNAAGSSSSGDDVAEQQMAARCWLLRQSGRLCEAVILRLDLAMRSQSEDERRRHEEEAIAMAYLVSPEQIAAEKQREAEEEEEMEGLRAELYHHLSRYFLQRAARQAEGSKSTAAEADHPTNGDEKEAATAVAEKALRELDGRIRSLSPPHFSAQHLSLLLQQQQLQDE